MATAVTTPAPRSSALRGYFETSLYLLLLVSVLSLISTGKLDLVSMLVTPLALLYKGYRWWRGHGPELTHRAATWLMTGYLAFFPVDLVWVSRGISPDAQNPALFSALLAAIHLMLFATLVRLFSARTTRDCMFLALLAFSAMLASAILTVDTAFIGFFLVFLALGVSTFVGLEMRRGAEGAAWTSLESGTPAARRLHFALGLTSAAVALSALVAGAVIFFLLPRFRAGYLSGFNLQPGLMSGFSDEAELGQIGVIQQSNEVVMRIRVEGSPSAAEGMHWRGLAFTSFDGRRWFTDDRGSRGMTQEGDGWILLRAPDSRSRPRSKQLRYTVLLEPLASDAIFVAAEPVQIRGQFAGAAGHREPSAGPTCWRTRPARFRIRSTIFPTCVTTPSRKSRAIWTIRCAARRSRIPLDSRELPAASAAGPAHPGAGPARSPPASAILSTRPVRSSATCPPTIPTRWTWPGPHLPIRWRIFFSKRAPATASISPRP